MSHFEVPPPAHLKCQVIFLDSPSSFCTGLHSNELLDILPSSTCNIPRNAHFRPQHRLQHSSRCLQFVMATICRGNKQRMAYACMCINSTNDIQMLLSTTIHCCDCSHVCDNRHQMWYWCLHNISNLWKYIALKSTPCKSTSKNHNCTHPAASWPHKKEHAQWLHPGWLHKQTASMMCVV